MYSLRPRNYLDYYSSFFGGNMLLRKLYVLVIATVFMISCSDDEASFSLLPDSDSFQQTTSSFNNKLDILFVIDDSGSMSPYQTNLSNNFSAFISDFITKGYDFRIAVITSSAWEADFYGGASSQNRARFRSSSGQSILDPDTLNIETAFAQNISAGTSGNGDERPLQSIQVALEHSYNSSYGFPRSDAYLAVIVVTDEDDYSNSTSTCLQPNPSGGCNNNSYSPAWTHPSMIGYQISDYKTYLQNLTNSEADAPRFNVSTIAVLDSACKNAAATHVAAMIGTRMKDMVSQTDGVQGSICDTNFSASLNLIQQQIGELSTQFKLSREPIPSTIRVVVNGSSVPNSTSNGWSYIASSNSVRFYGASVPAEGDAISINFDPATLGN
jgi:hypothetical protein